MLEIGLWMDAWLVGQGKPAIDCCIEIVINFTSCHFCVNCVCNSFSTVSGSKKKREREIRRISYHQQVKLILSTLVATFVYK